MDINLKQADFIISAASQGQLPSPDRPEVALAGRSNVGKSSFINCLLQRKNLARTSSKPGKTQQLNYYHIDQCFYLVDVPGYGYARVAKTDRQRWIRQLRHYFQTRENLIMTFLLVDFRHEPSDQDLAMRELLDQCLVPYFVIATKADKVKRNAWAQHTQTIVNKLDLVTADQVLPFSSVTGEGREEAVEILLDELSQAQEARQD